MENKTLNIGSIVIAIAVVLAAYFLANAYKNKGNQSNISVVGLGTKDFTSDLIVWNASFTKNDMELSVAYSKLSEDKKKIEQYLIGKGVKPNEIVFSAITTDKVFDYYEENDVRKSIFRGYALSQNVTIESKNVDQIEIIAREVTELINNGVELTSGSPSYFYTKLPDLKQELIEKASSEAKTRAEKIAEHAGSDLGDLKKASMGVFQITARNSTEEYEWGGTFNTSAKQKTASITVRLDYDLD